MTRSFLRAVCIQSVALILLLLAVTGLDSCKSGKDASQRKIERNRAKKDKQSKKNYQKLVKMHMKNQSAQTRAMMKKSNKEKPKNTPLTPSKGKRCKTK